MAEYTLKYINRRAKYDTRAFIEECEQRYNEQIEYTAEQIVVQSRQKPIVLITGPSSSGKTTTNNRLFHALAEKGLHAETISMDDYYLTRGSYEVPEDPENHVPDLESPECMNLPLLSQHLEALVSGEEIEIPRFDFETHTFIPAVRSLRLDPEEVVLIEGIHAFNPAIMSDLAHLATGVYVSISSAVQPEGDPCLEGHMLRFLRRSVRDSLFRSSPVRETIKQWLSVRRGERLYINPYLGQADVTIDTFIPYELNILAERLKLELFRYAPELERAGLGGLCDSLLMVEPIDYSKYIPVNSVLHEFIG